MAKGKNDYNKAYDEGYKKGKEDDILGGATHSIVTGFGSSGKKEDSYNKGYSDGAKDKYSGGGSDNYNGGTSESSGGCFITTATLLSTGKSDNCDELNTFRNFRDNWLAKQSDGEELINEYYRIAPAIVAAIDSIPDREMIYKELWKNKLELCLNLIQQNQFAEAKAAYSDLVIDLKGRFLRSPV